MHLRRTSRLCRTSKTRKSCLVMEGSLNKRALNLLGMATAARKLISGENRIVKSIQRQKRKFSDLYQD